MILFEDRNGENSQIDADKRNYNEQLVSLLIWVLSIYFYWFFLKKALSSLRVLLESLQNKGGSAFKSVPYAPEVLEKYIDGYLKQIDELEKKMKPSKRYPSKRAVCGSLNGEFFKFIYIYSSNMWIFY